MMTSRLFKILAILAVTALASGCKLEIVSVQGGDIAWSGGSCPEGSNCVIEITDPNYSNTFTVTPKSGYQFVKWQKAPGFLCGDSTNPVCAFAMPPDANLATAIIGLFATGYMMPIYKDVGIDTDGDGIRNELDEDDDNDGLNDDLDNCPLVGPNGDGDGCPISGTPITDTVLIDGKEWAQVDLFTNLSWNNINAVCPAGICGGSATLNGYDMRGWAWASISDVNDLINFYIGSEFLGPGPDGITEANSQWAPAILASGFRPTDSVSDGRWINAWTSSVSVPNGTSYQVFLKDANIYDSTGNDIFGSQAIDIRLTHPVRGSFFYKLP